MPLPPKKILVATDFSPHARVAADAAAGMARAFDAQVTLLHVVPLTFYAEFSQVDLGTLSSDDLQATVRRRVLKDAEVEQARLLSAGLQTKFLTVDGPPPAEIIRVAREGTFDLVVVGTHGRTGLMHLTLGGVAEKVVHLCSAAVLVVRLEAVPS